jgi:predicted P-loop ATPase/GTPase
MRILIVGLLPFDSGKTTVGIYLLRKFNEVGLNFFPLKPVAGFNGWYSFDALMKSLETGVLMGGDTLKYTSESGQDPKRINPFSVLLVPPDIELLNYRWTLYESLEGGIRVMVRMESPWGSQVYYSSIYRTKGIRSLTPLLDRLVAKFRAFEVETTLIEELVQKSWTIADPLVRREMEVNEHVLIESYNDAASPTESSLNVDYVIAVSPGKAIVYSAKDYRVAVSLLSSSYALRSSRVIGAVKPLATFDLSPKEEESVYPIVEFLLRRKTGNGG